MDQIFLTLKGLLAGAAILFYYYASVFVNRLYPVATNFDSSSEYQIFSQSQKFVFKMYAGDLGGISGLYTTSNDHILWPLQDEFLPRITPVNQSFAYSYIEIAEPINYLGSYNVTKSDLMLFEGGKMILKVDIRDYCSPDWKDNQLVKREKVFENSGIIYFWLTCHEGPLKINPAFRSLGIVENYK